MARRFIFRFERILDVISIREDQLQSEVGRRERQLIFAKEQLKAARTRLAQEQERMRSVNVSARSVDRILLCHNYVAYLRARVIENESSVAAYERALHAAREALIVAVKERKTFERLREREYQAFLEERGRIEQKEMDEIAQVAGRRIVSGSL